MVSRYNATGDKQCRGFIIDTAVDGVQQGNLRDPPYSALRAGHPVGKHGHYIANHLWGKSAAISSASACRLVPVYAKNKGYAHDAPSRPCDLWQFTSAGSVPGIAGNVDCNAIVSSDKDLEWFTGGTPPHPLPSAPNKAWSSSTSLLWTTSVVARPAGSACTAMSAARHSVSATMRFRSFINHIDCSRAPSTLAGRGQGGAAMGTTPIRHDASWSSLRRGSGEDQRPDIRSRRTSTSSGVR